MARQPRNRYVSGQKVRGAESPKAIAFARAIAPEILSAQQEDQAMLVEDCRVLAGSGVATALRAMGINH
jgi:hypothetical protein